MIDARRNIGVELDHRSLLLQDYALINPLQVSPRCYQDLEAVCLVPKGLERHRRLMPLLIALKPLTVEKRIELLSRSDFWMRDHDMPLFSALLQSDENLEIVKNRLVRNMVLPRPGGRSYWVRYHDPRVFRHLCWLLDTTALRNLMCMVKAWTWYDPDTRIWQVVLRPEFDAVPQYRLRFSADQWEATDQFELLNRVLRQLAADGEGGGQVLARTLLSGLLQAKRRGLTDADDVMLFAKQCWRFGLDWHNRSEAKRCIDLARERKSTYYSACVELGLQ